jgi:DNA-binding transcriptional regulator YiaG
MITSGQIRAARALLKWSSKELSQISGVGTATLKRYEVVEGVPNANVKTLSLIKKTLEEAGIEFIGTPEDDPGVRLLTNPPAHNN